jgi:hypothetical protein
MPSTFDPLLRLELQATNENATTWGIKTNTNLDLLASSIAGAITLNVAGSGDYTLSTANGAADEARQAILVLTGTLTGNRDIIVPSSPKNYTVINNTTGAFTITLRQAVGTGLPIPAISPVLTVCTSTTCALAAFPTTGGTITGNVAVTGNVSVAGGAIVTGNATFQAGLIPSSTFLRNRLINGNFAINQRGVSGTVTLAAEAYGHDRWKAGAGGCVYTFTTSGADTVITITAGSLLQIIEDQNVEGGVYTLSHAGTAQARVAVNGGTPSGGYVAAPLQTASATGGQTVTVEFTTGTVSRVQLEAGTAATPFERRQYGQEFALCQRYYFATPNEFSDVHNINTYNSFQFPTTMRAAPSLVITPGSGSIVDVAPSNTGFYSRNPSATAGAIVVASAEL